MDKSWTNLLYFQKTLLILVDYLLCIKCSCLPCLGLSFNLGFLHITRAVERSENPGVPVLFAGHNLPPLVEIGLTDLPKTGGAMAPLAPPGTTGLDAECRTAQSSAVAFKKYFIQFLIASWYFGLRSLFLSVFLLIFCPFSDAKFDNTLCTFTWMHHEFSFHLNFCPDLPNIYF